MKKRLLLLLAVVLMTALFGCSEKKAAQDGPVEVVVWHTLTDHHAAAYQAMVDDFNALHEGEIKVVVQPQPLQDFDAKVAQAVANGEGPDLISAYPTNASDYVEDGLILNFTPYIDDPEIGIPNFRDELSESIIAEISQWDEGSIYLIPNIKTGEVLFYNKTLFDELGLAAPKTWTDVENAAKAITAVTGKPAFGFDSLIDGLTAMFIQGGADYIDTESKTVLFNTPESVKRLEWFGKGVQEGYFRLVGEDQYFSNPFGSQAVAMYIGSSAGIDFVLSAVDGKFEVGIVGLPQEGPVEYANSWGGGMMVFKSDEATEKAAYLFVKYQIQPEINAKYAVDFGATTPYKSSLEQPVFIEYRDANPVVPALMDTISHVGYLPSIQGSNDVRTEIGKAGESVATGLMSAQEALDAAEAACNEALQR
ncbi:MAG: extracellular solute-binding protein [Erysipelotrichaceae bacterium]|jgi:ABC-type glycerol-3-phosphate transport system substrate-binding protein|nr:extracellular solute-binding protein [Erysipelotrichaceae bacterium]